MIAGTLAGSGAGTARPAGQANEADFLIVDLQQVTSIANGSVPRHYAPTLTRSSDLVAFKRNASVSHHMPIGKNITPTLVRGDGGGEIVISGSLIGVRRLTPIECERLQGFPDGWTAFCENGKLVSDSARYQMLGNAVCVPVAKWIGERIVKFDHEIAS